MPQQDRRARRGPHEQARQLLVFEGCQAPGLGGQSVRAVEWRTRERDESTEQPHPDHGRQQEADGKRRWRAPQAGPEAERAEQEARLHAPKGKVA